MSKPRYAIEVEHPLRGWIRLESRYANKKAAEGWFKFVRAAWHGLPVRAVKAAGMLNQGGEG